MSLVLTSTDTLTCSHAAPLVMTPASKLTVGGTTGVLTLNSVVSGTIPACTGTPPPGGIKCLKASVTSGQALKLSVGGDPVLLQGAVVVTNGTPPPVTIVPGPPNKLFAV